MDTVSGSCMGSVRSNPIRGPFIFFSSDITVDKNVLSMLLNNNNLIIYFFVVFFRIIKSMSV